MLCGSLNFFSWLGLGERDGCHQSSGQLPERFGKTELYEIVGSGSKMMIPMEFTRERERPHCCENHVVSLVVQRDVPQTFASSAFIN